MRIHIVSIRSDIYEDSYEEGLGKSTGCGLSVKIGKTFHTLRGAFNFLERYHSITDLEEDRGEFHTSNMVADHSEAQNGGWFPPTEEEFADWRKGKIKLYSEEFTVKILRVL
jgi:hypothetical protein